MKRIFVSYAHEDSPFVAQLAPALAEAGFEVWWDRELEGGDGFRAKIEESLNVADAVIVVWSGRSRASRWVLDEAEKGLTRNVLIPVRADKSPMPLSATASGPVPIWTPTSRPTSSRTRSSRSSPAAPSRPPSYRSWPAT